MAETNLAQAVEATNDLDSYDTNIKFLLADKQILARILKYAVQEFKDMAIDDIMTGIGDNIDIGTKPLDAGLSNLGAQTHPTRRIISREKEKFSLISVFRHITEKRK